MSLSVDQLLKLLGPSRVREAERSGSYLLLIPPEEGVLVKVERERLSRLSTELAWSFTTIAGAKIEFECTVIAKLKGFFRKKLEWIRKEGECDFLREVAESLLDGELRELMLKAEPDYLAIRTNGGLYVKVVKVLISPIATQLVHCYDLSLKLALSLSKRIDERL